MKRLGAIGLLLCVLPTVAAAHSFALYVSTPVTPPQEFRWWFPVAIAILLAGTFVIIWRILDRNWLASIGMSLCAIALFAVSFFMFGRFATGGSTAPPPGLGFPSPTFWGMGWRRAGWLFLLWNLYGYGFLLCSLYLCSGMRRTRKGFRKLAVCTLLLYVVGLVPYLATGALVHGWAGSYVHMGCWQRVQLLYTALVEYIETHDGRFPTADGMEPLLKELGPHLSEGRIRYSSTPIDVCPLVGAYERQPQHYIWNSSFSGVPLDVIAPDTLVQENVPISCPYHESMVQVGALMSMERDRFLYEERKKDRNKTSEVDVQ